MAVELRAVGLDPAFAVLAGGAPGMTAQQKRRLPARKGAATTNRRHQAADSGPNSTTQPLGCSTGDDGFTGDDDYLPDGQLDPKWADRVTREQAEEDQRRNIIHRLFARATCATCATGVVEVFTDEWFALPATQQIACAAVTGPQYLPEPPAKQVSRAISKGLDWCAEANEPSASELRRRRAEPGPLASLVFDPEAAQRWVETGSEVPA